MLGMGISVGISGYGTHGILALLFFLFRNLGLLSVLLGLHFL